MSNNKYILHRLRELNARLDSVIEFGVGSAMPGWARANPNKAAYGAAAAIVAPALYVNHKYKQRKMEENRARWKKSGLTDAIIGKMGRQKVAEHLRQQGHTVTLR